MKQPTAQHLFQTRSAALATALVGALNRFLFPSDCSGIEVSFLTHLFLRVRLWLLSSATLPGMWGMFPNSARARSCSLVQEGQEVKCALKRKTLSSGAC